MFDFLKKKINAFTEKVKKSIEKKERKIEKEAGEKAKAIETVVKKKPEVKERKKKETIKKLVGTVSGIEAKPVEVEKEEITEREIEKQATMKEALVGIEIGKLKEDDKRELKARASTVTKLKAVFAREITIEEKDIAEFLNDFELALLEGDVEQETAVAVIAEIKKELVGMKVEKRQELSEFLKKEIKKALQKIMKVQEIEFWKLAKAKKPLKILFLGPNGAGKTTSIAKIAFAFRERGMKAVLASADTFRAGSIEQLEKHAERIKCRIVKHSYGADPAAVAFDAVKAAEASKADAVLIDSAGRQETNKNLMQELKKIDRVVKPDLKIYVGEAFTGQALLQQAREFDKEVGIDAFILTKIDTDAKGGTAISLIYALKKPIIFIGTGQRYEDLVEFKPEFIIDRIV